MEHLASLRAIPGMTVLRPADAAETAEAWRVAVRSAVPVVLALTRQDLPALRCPRAAVRRGVEQGAYVVRDPEGAAFGIFQAGKHAGAARLGRAPAIST